MISRCGKRGVDVEEDGVAQPFDGHNILLDCTQNDAISSKRGQF